MVHVSKKYLDEDLKIKIEARLLERIKRVKSRPQLKQLLEELFTPSELVMLEKRLAISYLVEQKLPYKKMREILDVSPGTISFVKGGFKKKSAKNKKISSQTSPVLKASPRFIKRKFPTYKGKGRWSFLNSL